MKQNPTSFLILLICMITFNVFSQESIEQSVSDTLKIHVVTKNDRTSFVGRIISQDPHEVMIETKEMGLVAIPRHEIREIREVEMRELNVKGEYIPGEVFASRYFITTNGLSIAKGENYMIWHIFGPDVQFGVGKNFGLGIMTSWLGSPIIGTAKYSIPFNENTSLALGLLAGTDTWYGTGFRLALPYTAFTIGDRIANFTFSAGYGALGYKENQFDIISGNSTKKRVNEGRMLISFAGMFKAGRIVSIVFDSFIVPGGKKYQTTEWFEYFNPNTGFYEPRERNVTKKRDGFALILPGLRFQTSPHKAFQFGFAGIFAGGEAVPVPFPMVQFFQKL
ncbi:MAG: hypothetical protein CVT92_12735 [Bacteroidetes bacterium HGW-Bacteroidetes-1]|jgi:hypothetical protein|nr:MAG: hypothetical protein CVT92_12735 [Bacteroidetes bacterium HGW-Bacteroidetes-1]